MGKAGCGMEGTLPMWLEGYAHVQKKMFNLISFAVEARYLALSRSPKNRANYQGVAIIRLPIIVVPL